MDQPNRMLRNLVIAALRGVIGHLAIGMAIGGYARLPVTMRLVQSIEESFWLGPAVFAHDLLLNSLLSLPLAIGLCLLAPRHLAIYAVAAVVPVFIWWNWSWLGNLAFPDVSLGAIRSWVIQIGSLIIALLIVRRRVGVNPPNKSLRQPLDPAAPSADAKAPSASSAAELRCCAALK